MNDAIHLCISHSPLTSLVFRAGMRELNIPVQQVRSITRRSVRPVVEGICLDDLADRMELAYKAFRRSTYRRSIDELGAHLETLTGGKPFIAYIPHTHRIIYQEITGHPCCAGYVFLEEGFTSMGWKTRLGLEMNFLKRIQYGFRTIWSGSRYSPARPMFDHHAPGYRGALAISPHAFHGMPGVREVSSFVPAFGPANADPRLFVVLDSSYLHHGIRWEHYEEAMVDAILADDADSILIKFHFADMQARPRFESLQERIAPRKPVFLEKDYPIEENFRGNDRLLFAVSSLGYYTALAGGGVRCFAPSIKDLDVRQWIERQALPPDFEQVARIRS